MSKKILAAIFLTALVSLGAVYSVSAAQARRDVGWSRNQNTGYQNNGYGGWGNRDRGWMMSNWNGNRGGWGGDYSGRGGWCW